jgi:hypothetical protein
MNSECTDALGRRLQWVGLEETDRVHAQSLGDLQYRVILAALVRLYRNNQAAADALIHKLLNMAWANP